jgi:arylsulfatase A-like enzyme
MPTSALPAHGPLPWLRNIVGAVVLVLLATHVAAAETTDDTNAPPNILFVIADDWGLHAGAYGTRWVNTPAFDRVAAEGILFNKAHTPNAKCAPSRAILLTGRHSWQLREAGNHLAIFPPEFRVWPEVPAARGWHMGHTGKGWGPGSAHDLDGQSRQLTGTPFNRHQLKPPTTGISNNDYAANFADFLDAAPEGTPWCFWLGTLEPHRGYEFRSGVNKGGKSLDDIDQVPAYWPDHEDVRHDMLDYAFEVEHVDTHLARVLEELERRGLAEDTVVIVTSDHGMPFPRVKGYAYPRSNHVPLAVRWPGRINAPGRVVDDYVCFIDVAPTIVDLVGITEAASGMAAITGRSWRPIFESDKEGRIEAWRDHVLVGKERTDVGRPNDGGYPIRGILRDDFLYLRNYQPDRWPAGNPETGYLDTDASPTKTLILELGRADRADRYWQLNFGMRPAEELYLLTDDPGATVNLAAESDHADTRARLARELEIRLQEQGDPRQFGEGRRFDQYPVHREAMRGFYERFMKGEIGPEATGWVKPGDYEPEPIPAPLN